MHLADDDALGTVNDKGAVIGHQRHVAHIDVLLLDVADRAQTALLINIKDGQTEGNFQRSSIGQATLLTFLNVILRLFQLIEHEVEFGTIGKIADWKYGTENLIQTRGAILIGLQEDII